MLKKLIERKIVRGGELVTASAWAVMYERGELEAMTPGDEAWGVFGRGQVTEIHARGVSCNGRYYVCCYIHYPDGPTCSESLREGAVIRSASLTGLFSSAEIDDIERNMMDGNTVAAEAAN